MNDEQRLILQMVQEGKLTPAEADQLLASLPKDDDSNAAPAAQLAPPQASAREQQAPPPVAPDMQQFRRYWEIPFFVGLVLLGIAGLCVSNTGSTLLLICGWFVFVLAALVAIIGWMSQFSPWMHVRIKEPNGRRIVFSLPLPLRIIDPLLLLARPFVNSLADKDTRQKFDMAAALISTMGGTPGDEPLFIEIDEEDGDRVQVFLG